MASFLKKALPGVLPPALAANPDLNAEGMKAWLTYLRTHAYP